MGSPTSSEVPLLSSRHSSPKGSLLSSPPSSKQVHRRRSSGALFARKSHRSYFIVLLGLVAIIYLASYHDEFELHSPGTSFLTQAMAGRRAGSMADEHPLDKFVKTFPEMRHSEERGFPDEKRAEEMSLFDWPRTTKMFVFGDSYSNINVDYRKNGIDGGHHQHLHGKATDMKWSDFLYAVFHDYHILQYYNYARPGAVIDPEIIPPGLESYGTFRTQVAEFEELFTPSPGPPKVNWHGDDSLFVVFFGINDMGRMNREDLGRKDVPTTTAALAKSLVKSCRDLHALGARSFLIMNLPPLERSPKYNLPNEVGIKSHELIEESVRTYNQALGEEVEAWKKELEEAGDKESTIMYFDLESFWNLVLRYPEAFGLTECARYQMWIDEKRPNLGRMGYCYHDNQHISWSSAELIARSVNGLLHRHSRAFFNNNATETALRS